MGQDVVDHLLDPAPGLLRTGQTAGNPSGHLLDHVTPTPGGRGSAQLGQALAHHSLLVVQPCVDLLLGTTAADDLGQPLLGGEAGVGGVGQPAVVQALVRLARRPGGVPRR